MTERKTEILIIDDSVEIIKTLIELLKLNYQVSFATDGIKGFELAKSKQPDLILLDIMMQPLDGYEVCKQLKDEPLTADIPVIFLTAVSESMDEAKGFEAGGADYITKPFVPIVVLARIKHHLQLALSLKELKRLYSLALDANPITHLPGNNSIQKHINKLLEEKKKHYVLYADLDNFKSFNDKYGFANGDSLILATADIMVSFTKEMNLIDAFVGHIGGDDFVLTIDCDHAVAYAENLIQECGKMVKQFYSQDDLSKGYIEATNRQGKRMEFPLVSISVVGVNLMLKDYKSYLAINDICAELKSLAKKTEGSTFLIDRRGAD